MCPGSHYLTLLQPDGELPVFGFTLTVLLQPNGEELPVLGFLLPPLLQPDGKELPVSGVPCLAVETEAVDLVPKLNCVGGVDVSSPKVPQVDPS
jgi:hypothetical protein